MSGRSLLSFAALAVFGVSCGSPGEDKTIQETGFTWEADDGAAVEFPPGYGNGEVTGSFTKVADATGEESDERKAISAEYLLSFTSDERVESQLTLSMPLVTEWLPAGWNVSHLQPEYFDEMGGEWVPTGDFVYYDQAAGTAYFSASVSSPPEPPVLPDDAEVPADSLGLLLQGLNTDQFERKYRIRVYFFSNSVTVTAPGSMFRITYFPHSLGKKYSVMSNEEWDSPTDNAIDPAVPDFIEDLDAALNEAYNQMLTIQTSNGALFSPLSSPQDVTVTDCGGDAGESPIGGPLKITSRIAAMAAGYDDAQKKTFYTKDGYEDFLVLRLISTSDSNMYAAAHLLDWLAATYGETVVTDALSGSSVATSALSDALKDAGEAEGLGGAYEKFGLFLLTTPSGGGGMNALLMERITALVGAPSLSARKFTDTVTYIQLKNDLKPYSMLRVEIPAANQGDALLVVEASKSKGASLVSYAFDFLGKGDADYTGKSPVDAFDSFPYPDPVTVKNFGKKGKSNTFQQLIVNSSAASAGTIDVAYYILLEPEVKDVQDGAVLWSTARVGNIPKELIKGFYIVDETAATAPLNSKPVALPSSGTEMSYTDTRIKKGDNVVVAIVDKFDNVWPDVIKEPGSCDYIWTVQIGDEPPEAPKPGCAECMNDSCSSECGECDADCYSTGLTCLMSCLAWALGCSFDSEDESCQGPCPEPCVAAGDMDQVKPLFDCAENLCPMCDDGDDEDR